MHFTFKNIIRKTENSERDFFSLSISFSPRANRDRNLARERCQAKICLKLDSISAKRSSRSTPPNSSLNPRLREPARGHLSLGDIRSNFR